jgi:glycosyltransferase involved in cell wall biosynthesis
VLPRVGRAELSQELARAEMFVFPSLSEGFGSALLEAMAAALPVVSTPVGGAPDLLVHGRNGSIVPCGDGTALAAAMSALLDDPARRRKFGEAAQATARGYVWDAVNARFADEIVSAAEAAR